MLPATCFPNNCFCESIRDGFVLQPVNTYSSIFFVLIGLFIIIYTLIKLTNKNNLFFGIIYGLLTIFMGISTIYYHTRLTFWGQFLDVLGMYLLITFLLFYFLYRLYKFNIKKYLLIYLAINVISAYVLFEYPSLRRYFFAFFIILLILLFFWLQKKNIFSKKFLYSAIVVFVFSFLIWILDITKILCYPPSVFQGHALWHILNAFTILLIFFYSNRR